MMKFILPALHSIKQLVIKTEVLGKKNSSTPTRHLIWMYYRPLCIYLVRHLTFWYLGNSECTRLLMVSVCVFCLVREMWSVISLHHILPSIPLFCHNTTAGVQTEGGWGWSMGAWSAEHQGNPSHHKGKGTEEVKGLWGAQTHLAGPGE